MHVETTFCISDKTDWCHDMEKITHKLETTWLWWKKGKHFKVCLKGRWSMRKRFLWLIVLCGWSDVALLWHVSVGLGCGLSTLMRFWGDQELDEKTLSEHVDRPRETTWVTGNSWVHTSGNQNATPPWRASLRTRTLQTKKSPRFSRSFSTFFPLFLQGKCLTEPQLSLCFLALVCLAMK